MKFVIQFCKSFVEMIKITSYSVKVVFFFGSFMSSNLSHNIELIVVSIVPEIMVNIHKLLSNNEQFLGG